MKIQCTECGKRYDYDLYSGVCPKCGNYVRSEEELEENSSFSSYSADSGTTDYHMEESSNTISQEDSYVPPHTASVTKKVIKRIYTVVILFLIVVMGVGTYISIQLTKSNRQEERLLETFPEPSVIHQGEFFSYEAEKNRYNITIDSVTRDEDPALNVPKDYEMLVVSYHIERTFTGTGSGDYDAYYEICMNPYVETKSGSFLEAVSSYDLNKVYGVEDSYELEKMGISRDFSLEEGRLYYLVKKDDFKNLYITSFDYDAHKFDQGALRGIFRVEGLEVQR